MDAKPAGPPQAVVLDLGKQTGKRVKALRKGTGELLDDVHAAVAHLRESGVVAPDAQTIVVVVERKATPATLFPFLVG